MSPDDVVSYNLLRAREVRGWTQPEAAERVSRYLGREWSQQVYGDAERAHRVKRVKVFSAEEIVAFCRAFELPLVWFYLPQDPLAVIAPRNADADEGEAALSGDELLSLIFPPLRSQPIADLDARTKDLFSAFTRRVPAARNTAAYLNLVYRQNETLRSMLRAEFKAEGVDELPEQLEDLAARARRAISGMASDLMHDGIPVPGDSEEDP